jgi:hypothetical protein
MFEELSSAYAKRFLECDEAFAEIENFVGLGYRWANTTDPG